MQLKTLVLEQKSEKVISCIISSVTLALLPPCGVAGYYLRLQNELYKRPDFLFNKVKVI